MRKLQHSTIRLLLALLLIPALACGPMGCGPETVAVVGVVGLTAATIHQLQQVKSTSLDIEIKQHQLQELREGRRSAADRALNEGETRTFRQTGKAEINGQVLPVSNRRWRESTP